jgi:mannitol/fructose-specific phosphotransferase system IIA component (Ntr-type)
MGSLSGYTSASYIRTLSSVNKFQAIDELARVYEGTNVCSDVESLIKSLKEREELMSTGIGFGIAIPHAKIQDISDLSFAIGISKEGINFDSMDGYPVHLLILVVAGEKQHREYLGLLSNIMSMLKKNEVKEQIIASSSPEEVMAFLNDYVMK